MDSPPTVDRRVRRTQRLLSDALLALIVEKGIDAITIKDITDRADVAYMTFFRHYKDKDALLLQRLDEELATLRTGAGAAAQAMEADGAERAKGQLIFQYAQKNEARMEIVRTPPVIPKNESHIKGAFMSGLLQCGLDSENNSQSPSF